MYLHDPISNVLIFSVFYHISCGKNDMTWYGVEEDDSIDAHEVTANGDLLVLINDDLVTLVILTGSTCWILRRTFFL